MAFEYNLAIVFDDDIHREILALATSIGSNNQLESVYGEGSVPHATILKFAVDEELTQAQKEELIKLWDDIEVSFSGLRLLPSRKQNETPGIWIEISLVDVTYLIGLVEAAINALQRNVHVLNEVGRHFRPHVTIGKTSSYEPVSLPTLQPDLLRREPVPARLAIGGIGEGFDFIA